METNPYDVKKMILLSNKNPNSIITANRWLNGINFSGYNKIKLLLNYIFQFILKYFMDLNMEILPMDSDFSNKLLKTLIGKKHPFLLETI